MTTLRPTPRPWWPHPVMSLALTLLWLVLQQSVAVAHLLSGSFMGWLLPWVLHRFLGPASRPRGLLLLAKFTLVVLWDILKSNLAVARLVLNPMARPQPAWVPVPVTLKDPLALTLLATVITTTPGTVSCVVDDEGYILVHALDCADPFALALDIQTRYEVPLRAIFEGARP